MHKHVHRAKDQVKNILKDIKLQYLFIFITFIMFKVTVN